MKIVGFKIKIYYTVHVLLGSGTVQNTSNLFKEFIGRTFKYEFLLRTLLEELFRHHENRKKWKNKCFQDEFLGGSSYFIGLICSEIESLSIVNAFCTVSQRPNSISDHSTLD